jgi:hypothetical protein
MTVVATVNQQEAFLVQLNGDYNVPFDEVTVTVAGALPAGTVLATLAAAAIDADTAVVGILAQDKAAGSQRCRVMVRGNPSTVNAQAISVKSATIIAALKDLDIIVVNA